MVTGFKTEMCFKGHLSLAEAVQLFRSYTLNNGVSEGIESDQHVAKTDYKELIQFTYVTGFMITGPNRTRTEIHFIA